MAYFACANGLIRRVGWGAASLSRHGAKAGGAVRAAVAEGDAPRRAQPHTPAVIRSSRCLAYNVRPASVSRTASYALAKLTRFDCA